MTETEFRALVKALLDVEELPEIGMSRVTVFIQSLNDSGYTFKLEPINV